jgi:hypothetical protein
MFGELDDTQMNAGLIYLLAQCPQCHTRYAVAPDPFVPGQWGFYQRDEEAHPLSHICAGGLLCLRGHALTITVKQAVLTQAGEWLNVQVQDIQPVWN